jgi:hypothetical protein
LPSKESSIAAAKRIAAPVLAVSQARSTSVLAVGTYATARFDLSSSTPRISTPDHTRRETYPPFLALYTTLHRRHPCKHFLLTTPPSLVSTPHCSLSSSPLEYCGSGSNLLSRRPLRLQPESSSRRSRHASPPHSASLWRSWGRRRNLCASVSGAVPARRPPFPPSLAPGASGFPRTQTAKSRSPQVPIGALVVTTGRLLASSALSTLPHTQPTLAPGALNRSAFVIDCALASGIPR